MINFSYADEKNRRQLYLLWRECFKEEKIFTDLFFNNFYSKAKCLAAFDEEIPYSALYLLDAKLNVHGKFEKAAYIYGAATLPEYRNRGIMQELLNYASDESAKNDINYLFLMPANESLFDFYKKCGYKNCFKIRTVTKRKDDVLLTYKCIKRRILSKNIDNIYNLRFNNICVSAGNVVRSHEQIEYAIKLVNKENGDIICDENGYLIYRQQDNCTEIIEACCNIQSFSELFPLIIKKTKSEYYKITLPVTSDIFPNEGNIKFNGMLKSKNGDYDLGSENPYMGINFD